MGLRDASLGDLYAVWTVVFTIGFVIAAMIMARSENLKTIAVYLATAAGCAQAIAALFAVAMWSVIQAAP